MLVATSGGGISAAYWTASTLAYLEQKFGAPFTERLFAVSGVSGGSLGAATYVALKPILIIIDNDTIAPNLCRRDGSVDQLPSGEGFNSTVSEVTAPAQALLQTRAARGNLAEVTAANLVEGIGGTVIEVPLASVLRARLAALGAAEAETIAAVESRYVEPPLGWSLSQEVREGMDNTLQNEQGGLDRQLRYLAIALGLEQGEVPPCAAHEGTRSLQRFRGALPVRRWRPLGRTSAGPAI